MGQFGHITEDKAVAEFLGLDEVDYGSDTSVKEEEKSESTTSVCERTSRPAPNPFPERGAAAALTALGGMSNVDSSIITNPLDEEQQRLVDQAESAQPKAYLETKLQRYSEYTFTPLAWKNVFAKRLVKS